MDRRIAEARALFRSRVDAVGTLGPTAARPTVAAGLIAAVRRWWSPPMGDLERLERHVEEAQRQVSRIALEIDGLSNEEAGIAAEMAAVRDWVESLSIAQAEAEHRAEALRRALVAVDVERARASPGEGAALEADRAVLQGNLTICEADVRALERAAVRGSAVITLGSDALELCGRLRSSLDEVHQKGTSLLHALDVSLGQLAADARAGDLSRALVAGIEPLRGSVGRVHLQARQGAELLMFRLDALTDSPDLLAPSDPARVAAEAEVARIVTRRLD